MVSQQLSVSADAIIIRLISTQPISEAKIAQARQDLVNRTGRDVQLSVEAVASKRELAELMERLAHPAPLVVKETTVGELQQELLAKIRPAVEEIWPSTDAPIQDLNVELSATGIAIDITYKSDKELGDIPVQMVERSLQTRLGMPSLVLAAERETPEKGKPAVGKKR